MSHPTRVMLEAYAGEFQRYRATAERALAQVSDESLNQVPMTDGNSLAMLVRHISGNLLSRFTDFLTTDGEKPWRNRESEFEERVYTRAEVDEMWQRGWTVLEETLDQLEDADLSRVVRIRELELRVDAALARSVAHVAYHTGQMVLLARLHQGHDWKWISVPKGDSARYNANPTMEKRPG